MHFAGGAALDADGALTDRVYSRGKMWGESADFPRSGGGSKKILQHSEVWGELLKSGEE